jgi:hypothetical protein
MEGGVTTCFGSALGHRTTPSFLTEVTLTLNQVSHSLGTSPLVETLLQHSEERQFSIQCPLPAVGTPPPAIAGLSYK